MAADNPLEMYAFDIGIFADIFVIRWPQHDKAISAKINKRYLTID